MLTMKITASTDIEILLPPLPNSVRTARNDVVIPLEQLTDEQITALGEQWTRALINKASERRNAITQI